MAPAPSGATRRPAGRCRRAAWARAECRAMKCTTFVPLVVILLGAALVRVENERHALLIGMSSFNPTYPLSMFQCLKKAETRTGWWWHLHSALVNS